jgi:cytochrome P450
VAFFNPSRPSYVRDPYPALARLRAEAPVHYSTELDAWIITSYAECFTILHDVQTYGTDFFPWEYAGRDEEVAGREEIFAGVRRLTNSEGPEHVRKRAAVGAAFTQAAVDAVRPRIVAITEQYVAELTPGEPVDVIETFAKPIPDTLLTDRLGVTPEDYASVTGWARAMLVASEPFASAAQMDEGRDGRAELTSYLAAFPSGGPDASGVVALARRAHEASEVSADEVLSVIVDVALGDGLTAMIGSALLTLSQHPAALKQLHEDPSLIPGGVEELARFDPPPHVLIRVANSQATLGGQQLEPGAMLFLMVGAANRDPEQFDDPDRFDIKRANQRHLSFSAGEHFCVGAPFSRIVLTETLTAFLARFGHIELVERGVRRPEGFLARGFDRLDVIIS